MAQMHSSFATQTNEVTSVAVTYETVTKMWGVTLVAVNTDKNEVVYQMTMGAYVSENGAYELYAKMANAMEYRGYEELRNK